MDNDYMIKYKEEHKDHLRLLYRVNKKRKRKQHNMIASFESLKKFITNN